MRKEVIAGVIVLVVAIIIITLFVLPTTTEQTAIPTYQGLYQECMNDQPIREYMTAIELKDEKKCNTENLLSTRCIAIIRNDAKVCEAYEDEELKKECEAIVTKDEKSCTNEVCKAEITKDPTLCQNSTRKEECQQLAGQKNYEETCTDNTLQRMAFLLVEPIYCTNIKDEEQKSLCKNQTEEMIPRNTYDTSIAEQNTSENYTTSE